MRGVLLTPPPRHWECLTKGCDVTDVTAPNVPNRMHRCGPLGLDMPLVPAGTRGENRIVRPGHTTAGVGHQVGVDGRPVAAVETWREDGQDCTVFLSTVSVGSAGGGR